MALYSNRVTHSSVPVFESNARKRRSLVAPMNTSPPAVAIDPPRFRRPVSFLPSGSSSVTPSRTFQAISPVAIFTASKCPHGGLLQGQLDAPNRSPFASVFLSQNFEAMGTPHTLR